MRRVFSVSLLFVLTMCLVPGVSAQEVRHTTTVKTSGATTTTPNREKYHDVRKAAMQIKSAVSVGTSYREFGPLVQNLATELDLLPKAKTSQDSELVADFREVLADYKGAIDAWREKLDDPTHALAPDGGIWVPWMTYPQTFNANARSTLVGAKRFGLKIYPLPNADSDELKGTGYIFADELIQAYWADASKHLAEIDDMFE